MGNPDKIGDIQPYAELHRGAMTTVYKGFQKPLDRFVLLKILHPRFGKNERDFARFVEEVREAQKVKHANIVSIYAHGKENGKAYLATEFIDGVTLAALVEEGPLPANLAAYVLLETTHALKAAHDVKVLHRDVKSKNILISKEGRIKVADVGMVSLSPKSMVKDVELRGAPAYQAPELAQGKSAGQSSDLFSLGAVLFEMLLGKPAFIGSTTMEVVENVLNHDPVSYLQDDESIPSQVRRICQQLLKKKAEQRYQDCDVLLADLNAFRKTRGQGAVATAGDMKSFLADPEAYIRKMRDKPVSLRTREARPRAEVRSSSREQTSKPTPKSTKPYDRKKIFSIAATLVLLFGGLSFAGGFFFEKDGSWGARNNPNGSASSSSSGGGTAITRRSGSASGTPVRSRQQNESKANNSSQESAAQEPVKEVAVLGEDQVEERTARESDAEAGRASAIPDTVVLVSNAAPNAGKMLVDASPWAAVYLAGDSLGITPLPLVVNPGTYTITLKNPDFPPFKTLVDVVPGRETPVKVSLWSLVGQIRIEVEPSAEIYINGEQHSDASSNKPAHC